MALSLEVVSPARRAWKGTVVQVQVPGSVGEFGVLENHASFLGTTRPGQVILDAEGGQVKLVVGAGFAEVGPEGVTLLVDSCEEAGSYDKDQAAKDLAEAEASLADLDPTSNAFARARNSADLADMRIKS